ncbi:MAG: cysteine--tRNA ligase [Candidatus Aenigmarchaeota archaeon]|nr:cysteine--tRNA ligase [Candidatus Aenigmarchaeota archaeon]
MELFNTMGRKKQEFKSIMPGEVRLYACGPTVYDYAHIGHFRAYVFVDTLVKILEYNKFKVKHVMNITDVGHLTDDADQGEDKVEKKARKEGKSAWEIADYYTEDFFDAMEKLNVKTPDIVCKATDHIQDMINLVKDIEKNGYTYETSDGIYFDTSQLNDYGKLAGLDIEGLREGARVNVNPEKKHPTDFALWKFSPNNKKRQMEWDSPWGKGFPGWHIECTAMSMRYLGETLDIHTGGIDHIPVHHTNEIAQAESATGKRYVNYWLHNNFITVNGEKMSKSKGNFHTMKDIENRGIDPMAVRYLFLTANYRTQLNFTWKSVKAAEKTLDTLREHVKILQEEKKGGTNLEKVRKYKNQFLAYINDDLNTPEAISLMWKLIREEKGINSEEKYKLILEFDKIFGLNLDKIEIGKILSIEIKKLIKERQTARKNKNYERADEIRDELKKMGYEIQDTKKGIKVRRINS